jgi:hypothetical protein
MAIVAILLFSFTPILEPSRKDRVLKIVIPEDLDYEDVFKSVFKKYTTRAHLITMKTVNMGSLYNLTYSVRLKSGVREKAFLDDIRVKNCNLKVMLSEPVAEDEI